MILDLITKPRASGLENPAKWLADVITGDAAASGIKVTDESAITYSGIFAAIRIIAQTIGIFPWHVFERQGESRVLRDDLDVDYLIWKEPNPDMASQSFREALQGQALLFGNGYAEIVRDTLGNVVAMNPVDARTIKVVRDTAGGLVYEVHERRNDGTEGPVKSIPARDMFHLRGISPDGIVGYFLMKLARQTIGLGLATERYGATWFGNMSMPGGLFEYPGTMTEQGQKNIQASKDFFIGGPDRANKIPILEEGMKFTPLSVNPEESQFLQTRTYEIQEVSRWTGVPPHMLAELSRGTFSNIEHMGLEYVIYVAQPWATRWENEADRKLLPGERTLFTKMNMNALLRGDMNARRLFYEGMSRIGAMSPNEIRSNEDMNPYDGGDVHVMQAQMVPVNQLGQSQSVSGPIGADVERVKRANARVFAFAAERLVIRESKAAKHAAKKPRPQFDAWAEDFYPTFTIDMVDTLLPAAEAMTDVMLPAGINPEASQKLRLLLHTYAAEHVDCSGIELDAAYSSGSVADLCDTWTITRPAKMTLDLTERVAVCVTAMQTGDPT